MDSTDALPNIAPVGEVAPEQAQNKPLPPPKPPPPADTPALRPAPVAAASPAPAPAQASAPGQITPPAIAAAIFEPAPPELIAEIKTFEQDSCARYKFNNGWDIVLSVLGIMLSIAIIGAGFLNKPWVSAILGAIVGAVVTAQKAFPFGSRAAFYRILIGQARNLLTRALLKIMDKNAVVNTLSSLRMDYAQQLPRGTSAQSSDTPGPPAPNSTAGKEGDLKPDATADAATLP
jgi:hypothetical protein